MPKKIEKNGSNLPLFTEKQIPSGDIWHESRKKTETHTYFYLKINTENAKRLLYLFSNKKQYVFYPFLCFEAQHWPLDYNAEKDLMVLKTDKIYEDSSKETQKQFEDLIVLIKDFLKFEFCAEVSCTAIFTKI